MIVASLMNLSVALRRNKELQETHEFSSCGEKEETGFQFLPDVDTQGLFFFLDHHINLVGMENKQPGCYSNRGRASQCE